MKKPDIPKNEPDRIQTLHSLGILDTPPEERFDRITRMAKRLFNVPIALVSIVDENRQWFKSCVGVDVSETPRDISFCGHTILGNDIFIIPNALEDKRFADNPLVVNEPNIRFYAGCPLKAPNGLQLGTLCIIDDQPRNFTKEDLEALVDLASMVEREIAAIHLATMDELTNISNRRGFTLLAQHSIKLCKREKMPISLAYMDLDNFKPINDTYGHAAGDDALITFTEVLAATCRSSDVIARLGGDEFAVLFANTSKKETEALMMRFQQALNNTHQKTACEYDIIFSYGVAEYNEKKHPTLDALLTDADTLMYKTKNAKH